ncbi:acyl-coenzyme A thioesterase 13 [Prunus yedoensis var. nudiflora]|uniref:Acyl-coenzyme A thioesterase 13 n=1 Tax=Prunus yedoensis var. nudiflora TaxID=2094558 RepID=A0A314YDB9_PRUYE|nr:acyl-coenzyme A thioesterase 13 [Prunus yedoensis var. nudiflora]
MAWARGIRTLDVECDSLSVVSLMAKASGESVKKFLEKEGEMAMTMDGHKFFESFIMKGIKVDLLEPGRIVCSFKVPPRLLKGGNFMHGAAYAYPGEEVEIEAKALRVWKAVGVASVELRKKKTCKIIAQGRHTKYLALATKIRTAWKLEPRQFSLCSYVKIFQQ